MGRRVCLPESSPTTHPPGCSRQGPPLQQCQRLLELSEIRSRARGDDTEFVGIIAGELGSLWAAGKFNSLLRPTHAPLAVGDQWQQLRFRAHPTGGPEFGERLGPVAAVVGGDTDCFSDRGDTPGPGTRGLGMCECGLRVRVEQFTGGDEVTGDGVGGGLVQGEQLGPNLRCELFGLHGRRDGGPTRLLRRRFTIGGPPRLLWPAGPGGPGPYAR